VVLKKLHDASLEECEELYDRVVAAKAGVMASVGKVPEDMVEHAKWMIYWCVDCFTCCCSVGFYCCVFSQDGMEIRTKPSL
jgi:hypothetical protein